MAKQRLSKQQRQIYSKTSYMIQYRDKTMVKLSDLTNQDLGRALSMLAHKEIDMKTAWAITRLMEDRTKHLKTLEHTRKSLLDKYCDKDDKGEYKVNEDKTRYMVADEASYNLEYGELIDIEVEVTMLKKDLIDRIETITPTDLIALKPFIH
jgi:hypothetical protein